MSNRDGRRAPAPAPVVILILTLALAAPAAGAAPLPTPAQVRAAWNDSDAVLLDRNGLALQSARIDLGARRAVWVAYAELSPALVRAVVAAEDRNFFSHDGVDLAAVAAAAWDNLLRTRARGASTITMQLAALLAPDQLAQAGRRSLGQKWSQAQAARALEHGWSKQQILEAYLNLLAFRGELQGIGAAAQALFGKAPSGLNEAESALLAAMIRSPNAAPAVVSARACALLRAQQLATPCARLDSTLATALTRRQPGADAQGMPALLAARKLAGPAVRRIASTLDAGVQQAAADSLRAQIAVLGARNVSDGAVVVLDNASGEVLAWVGNAGDSSVDGVSALRQAGSTLKPFLYELALERKLLTAASAIDDTAVDIVTPSGMYIPQNYDRQLKGYVSVRTSLAGSLNVPAVRTLMLVGLERFYERLRALGFDSLDEAPDYYGYSLALGSGEVTLLALANAYRTLANGGVAGAPQLLAQAGARTPGRRLLDPRASFVVADILSDRAARSVTFGLSNELATPYWSAVKTGTSKDMRDNWCIGFSEKYTVGVWVGNFDGAAMWDVSGVTGAAPVWRDVMDYLQRARRSAAPAAPPGLRRQLVQFEPAIEPPRSEWFIEGTESTTVAIVPAQARAPHIRYPAATSIIAIDPDIPAEVQRLFFQAQAGAGLDWQLDGATLAPAAQAYAWSPQPGRHTLALIDAQGRALDTVEFSVRGSAVAP